MGMPFFDPDFSLAMARANGAAEQFADRVSAELNAAGFAFERCLVHGGQEALQAYWSDVVPPLDAQAGTRRSCDFRVELMRQVASDGRPDCLIDVRYRLDRLGPRVTLASETVVQYRIPAGVSPECLGECLAQMLATLPADELVSALVERLRDQPTVAPT